MQPAGVSQPIVPKQATLSGQTNTQPGGQKQADVQGKSVPHAGHNVALPKTSQTPQQPLVSANPGKQPKQDPGQSAYQKTTTPAQGKNIVNPQQQTAQKQPTGQSQPTPQTGGEPQSQEASQPQQQPVQGEQSQQTQQTDPQAQQPAKSSWLGINWSAFISNTKSSPSGTQGQTQAQQPPETSGMAQLSIGSEASGKTQSGISVPSQQQPQQGQPTGQSQAGKTDQPKQQAGQSEQPQETEQTGPQAEKQTAQSVGSLGINWSALLSNANSTTSDDAPGGESQARQSQKPQQQNQGTQDLSAPHDAIQQPDQQSASAQQPQSKTSGMTQPGLDDKGASGSTKKDTGVSGQKQSSADKTLEVSKQMKDEALAATAKQFQQVKPLSDKMGTFLEENKKSPDTKPSGKQSTVPPQSATKKR